jgi:hypothetical protein
MAAKKQTTHDRLNDVSSRLTALDSIIKLCAFSAEARRVLGDFDSLKSTNPDFEKAAFKHVYACNEWGTHDDTLGLVLKNAAYEIGELRNLIDCAEVHVLPIKASP